MDKWELMRARHSVRRYEDKPIEKEIVQAIQEEIDAINAETGFHFQMHLNEPEVFTGMMAHYGSFSGCSCYFALIAPKGKEVEAGYYGERLVLKVQELGLNTCWIYATYKKSAVKLDIPKGEKNHIIISFGYGATQGHPRKTKPVAELSNCTDTSPQWYKDGMEAVLLAPTAMNQQKFYFENIEGVVSAKAKMAVCGKIDLGIAKYHFELGAGKENFTWK